MNDEIAAVLVYNRYMGRDSQSTYNTEHFCGSCRRALPSPYGFKRTPDDLEAECDSPYGLRRTFERDQELEHWAYCPWCGATFVDEWWRDRTIQNERAIDHFNWPGHHKGDTAVIPGSIGGHWLSTNGDQLCWCDPVVVPSIMGCEILHQDKVRP